MAKMTVARAATTYIEAKRDEDAARTRKEAAGTVLKQWFQEHPDKRDYRGLIGYAAGIRRQLDTARVKAELGDRLPEFEKVVTFEQLSILK